MRTSYVPPWRRGQAEAAKCVTPSFSMTFAPEGQVPSQPAVDTRGTTEDSRKSCTLRPDWCPPLEGAAASHALEGDPARKVSMTQRGASRSRKMTFSSSGVQALLQPADPAQSPLEKLAPLTRKSALTPPLYIVHPITGAVKILRQLAEGLHVRCYGVRRTPQTPDTSVERVAEFYCQALTSRHPSGAFLLAGYSYGGLVAFHMARWLREEAGRQVAVLIMIDGSPDYVKYQVATATRRGLDPNGGSQWKKMAAGKEAATSAEEAATATVGVTTAATSVTAAAAAEAAVESEMLMYFMGMYGPVKEPDLVRAMLEQLTSTEDRVAAAMDITLGIQQVSNVAQGHWLGLRSKMEKSRQGAAKVKVGVSDVTQDVISLQRQQKAMAFLQAARIADRYEVTAGYRFEGDIHLLRIQSTPPHYFGTLSEDYNLSALCTGAVHVNYVSGEHESMMEWPHVESVTVAVNKILEAVMV